MEKVLNKKPSLFAEYLAKYVDFHLKKSSTQTGISDSKLE